MREALRLILDLELGDAKVVLLEEPEVHLHPGLEFAVHSYLQQKSRAAQIFLTTHSTNFVDLVSQQNIYLFKKDASKHTICERVDEGSASAKIPSELGLRLSTVFMFDRLVFVEGPSDESVLRQMASKIGCDIAKAGVAFVHMGGIMNFTHYAAEGTLDILSRRQVKMWFLVDRDERNDKEILGMVSRLGSRAELVVLGRRDIENFLIDASAIRAFLLAKSSGAPTCPSLEEVETAMNSAVDKVRNDVVRLRVEKQLLAPVYLRGKNIAGTIEERIDGAIESLAARKANVASVRSQVDLEVNSSWNLARAIELAPGATFLDETCRNLGYRFNKDSGDSGPLARCLTEAAIPSELKKFLNTVVGV